MIISSRLNVFKLLLALVLCPGFINAQTTEILEASKLNYPNESILFAKNCLTVKIKLVKDVPVVTHQVDVAHLVLDKSGILPLSEDNVQFTSFEKIDNLVAYSLIPTEKGSKKIPATGFTTRDVGAEGSVFHDDTKETAFLYPSICEGALRVLNYETITTEYHFPFGFTFNSSIPSENTTFIIEADSAIHISYKLFNVSESELEYTEKIVKGVRIQTWVMKQPTTRKKEDFAPTNRYYAPHILAQIDYFRTKQQTVNVLGTPKELHDYYSGNVAEVVNEKPSTELKMIADSITAGITSDIEKVKAVYYWVQNNIKYIAFEEGMGGFVPRQPSKVIGKRYGDCKDMASLIYSMLKSINITSYLTWIGSRALPYKYTEFPSSYCDDHMIAVYKENDRYYFLDATNPFQQYVIPTGFIQGKQAMVHIDQSNFELIDVPVPAAEATRYTDTTTITIDGKNISARSKAGLTGYYQVEIGQYLKDVPEKDLSKAVESIGRRGNNSYLVKSSKVGNLGERDSTLIIEQEFTVNNYVTSFQNETYFNMILEKELVEFGEIKPERTIPLELNNKSLDSYTTILKIPEGYQVKSVPKDVSFSSDILRFDVAYAVFEDRVVMTLTLKLDFLLLTADKFADWNRFFALKKAATNESVVLQKK
ncbi:MAG: transglutaminase-like domain-containing protein [Fluviicola sp.]|nr:transglutaminase-like domain-containing protein [Fluviicola sp.]